MSKATPKPVSTEEPKKRVARVKMVVKEPLTEVPMDFDFSKYRPLKKRDFAEEHMFYEHKAMELEAKAKLYREDAAESKALGSTADRAAARKLVAMTAKLDELRKGLADAGIDVDALLAAAAKAGTSK